MLNQGQPSVALLTVMQHKLSAAYQEYNSFHSKVMALISDTAIDRQAQVYQEFEDLFDLVSTNVEELLLVAKDRSTTATNTSPQLIIQQQPLKAPIPTFDGSYAAWPKFKAIFLDIMANSGDTDAMKLYHLEKALVGEAAGVLDAKVLSDGNYQHAWSILNERFENIRVIVENHFQSLLSLKVMTSESHKELRSLVNDVTRHVESLRYLKQEISGVSEHMIVFLIANSLDKSTRKAWESTQRKGELPKYEPTINFLMSRAQILENCDIAFQLQAPSMSKPKLTTLIPRVIQKSHAAAANSTTFETICDFCGESHRNFQCSIFLNLSTTQKREKVRSAGLCYNCLRKGHITRTCSSPKSCRKCEARHHTLLHEDVAVVSEREFQPESSVITNASMLQPVPSDETKIPDPVNNQVFTSCSSYFTSNTRTVLLLTAVVEAFDTTGQLHSCRVLLDSGSQVNFITEQMTNRLGLKKHRVNIPITGINELRSHARDKVLVKFRSRVSKFSCSLECLVTPKVTGKIPNTKINVSDWCIPDGVVLADPAFHTPDKMDMLIGGELFFDIMKAKSMALADNLPQLRKTYLGWIVAGVFKEPHATHIQPQYSNVVSIEEVETMMQQFWKIEELPYIPKLSVDEIACKSHFLSTYKRNTIGRFVVQQPFKESLTMLDDCRDVALKRFLMLEKRLLRNPELQTQYIEFIREYELLGHCHQVIEADDPSNQQNFYMPHHAVLRPFNSSTKCRVVFDASAKASPSNLALNDVLLIGPVVQSDLYSIMLRFRTFKIAFTADIAKMYRQILMVPKHQHYQRIFWREKPSHPLRVLELDTVTYGTAPAPYQATRCLMQLAEEEKEAYPIAAEIIKNKVYMDDIIAGADTVSEAIEAQQQLKQLLARGCFPIHK
ncbi:uncharacterized protein LOC131429270 [Malaya genurostris]|uniref:uncharacterized protein LOC131429270 n=1 Tax=Malaya genurostris TaxID=325434 RepID=UPI0026F3DC41|nr:uncharacterized protein LOC131429270 [Malaya genurostris]